MSTASKLDRLYRSAERICFDRNTRIVLMSDCHRGIGNHGDNFLKNQSQVYAALSYYYHRNFIYMELGDGDELWENRSMQRIMDAHADIFRLLSCFNREGRLFMLYGNHDRKKQWLRGEMLPGLTVKEGLVLVSKESGRELFLVHGHQGDLWNDTLWIVSGFLVRYVWRTVELWGGQDPTSAARNYKLKRRTERRLENWAHNHKLILVSGHTHRSVLPSDGRSFYVNTGSCVHPDCVTALELENNQLTLVKWCVGSRQDGSLFIGRSVLEGPVDLERFYHLLL